MRRASLPVALVLLIALTGCIHVTVPAPVPSEPAVEVPVAPVENGPSAGDIAACEGLVAVYSDIIQRGLDSGDVDASMREVMAVYSSRAGLADDPMLSAQLRSTATSTAKVIDEKAATGAVSAKTALDLATSVDASSAACEGIA